MIVRGRRRSSSLIGIPIVSIRLVASTLAIIGLGACGSPPKDATSETVSPARRETIERVQAATKVVRELRGTPDAFVPRAVAAGAQCVAVVPGLVHAGFLIGARAGRGVVTCREKRGAFSRPSFFRITGASAGVQAGVESVDVVMLLMTEASANTFMAGKAQLGATTSIAAGPVGREAQASSDVTLSAEVLYYSRSSGLFVGLDFSGTVLEPDEESSRAFYGDPRDFRALLRAPPPSPPAGREFVEEVERSFASE
jgi:lipid-binding SYLF domain-containing protein